MKIIILILGIILIITSALLIRLTIRCNEQSKRITKLNTDYDELKANYIATVNTNSSLEKEVKRLDSEIKKQELLNDLPVQTVIKEVVVNPKIKKFAITRILTAEVLRFGGENYKEMVKKEMAHQLVEDLISNEFVTFYEEKDLYRLEETITARIDVLGR